MPASSTLISEAERSGNPEQVLKTAYDRGEYQEYSNSPNTVMRNGRPRRKIKGLSAAQRYASYRRNGSGVHTSKLTPRADQFKDQRQPDGSLTPDPDMVTTASGAQVVKSTYDAQQAQQAQKANARRPRMVRPSAPASSLDGVMGATATPKPPLAAASNEQPRRMMRPKREPRPEATFEGKTKAEFFGDAAQRQKRSNAFAQYTAPEKKQEPMGTRKRLARI